MPDNSPNAMSSLAAAKYVLTYKHPENFPYSVEELQSAKEQFFDQADTISIVKKTKKGERELDLKPLIYEFDIMQRQGVVEFHLFVSTGSVDNIKPELVLQHFFTTLDCPLEENAFFIHRVDMFAQGEEGFISLGDVGYEK